MIGTNERRAAMTATRTKTTIAIRQDNQRLRAENRRLSQLTTGPSIADKALALRWLMEQPEIACSPERYHTAREQYALATDAWLRRVGGEAGIVDILEAWKRMLDGEEAA